MPLPRVRLRTLMIAVAVAAVMIGAGLMWRRAVGYRARAVAAANAKAVWAGSATISETIASRLTDAESREPDPQERLVLHSRAADHASQAAMGRARAGYYLAMEGKYRRAARYPWFTVEPDLPPPK